MPFHQVPLVFLENLHLSVHILTLEDDDELKGLIPQVSHHVDAQSHHVDTQSHLMVHGNIEQKVPSLLYGTEVQTHHHTRLEGPEVLYQIYPDVHIVENARTHPKVCLHENPDQTCP